MPPPLRGPETNYFTLRKAETTEDVEITFLKSPTTILQTCHFELATPTILTITAQDEVSVRDVVMQT